MRLFLFSLVLCFCTLTPGNSFSQAIFSVSGSVLEENGKPVYGAQVFLNGTAKSTVSSQTGNYTLSGLTPGSYELVVSLLGYKTVSKTLKVENADQRIDITLQFSVVALKEVIVQPDPHREQNFEVFKENFLGRSANSRECRIVNPEVLNITFDPQTRILEADSGGDFVIIENKALGYLVKYLILQFSIDFQSNNLVYEGKTAYQDLKGSASRKRRWQQARVKTYNGSAQHFLAAVYHNKVYEEGYTVNKLIRVPNADRPSDSMINANIRRLSAGRTVRIGKNDSVDFWIAKRKLPRVNQYLIKGDIRTDSMVTTYSTTTKKLRFDNYLYVTYTREREPIEFSSLRKTYPRPLDQPNHQVSVVSLKTRATEIDSRGNPLSPLDLFYEGYWAFEKVADLLPSDYLPPGN